MSYWNELQSSIAASQIPSICEILELLFVISVISLTWRDSGSAMVRP